MADNGNGNSLGRPRLTGPRVVVTGMGAFTPIGNTPEAYWTNLVAGVSGIGPITSFDAKDLQVKIAGEVKDFTPGDWMEAREARRINRFAQLAIASARQALADSGLAITDENADRIAVMFNTGGGGVTATYDESVVAYTKGLSRVSPLFLQGMIANMAACQVSLVFGIKGPLVTSVAACASSVYSFIDAYHMLRRGEVDAVVAGGTESTLNGLAIASLQNMHALSRSTRPATEVSRPFDKERDGFVFAEGAGAVILETEEHARARGAHIYAEVLGGAQTGDAYHVTAPAPGGAGAALAMRRAITWAGLEPPDIDLIVAHGTSTPLNDAAETAAIKTVFGEHAHQVAITAPKSMIGHGMGSAGVHSGIAAIFAIRDQLVPPTLNLTMPDPECDLDYTPNAARPTKIDRAIVNGFGFGGMNAVTVIQRYEG
jgi:3-oxoacyl-[acyl-carrier-protein] synthase II